MKKTAITLLIKLTPVFCTLILISTVIVSCTNDSEELQELESLEKETFNPIQSKASCRGVIPTSSFGVRYTIIAWKTGDAGNVNDLNNLFSSERCTTREAKRCALQRARAKFGNQITYRCRNISLVPRDCRRPGTIIR